MSTTNALVAYVLALLIISYGLGLIIGKGSPGLANKIIAWELKKLYQIVKGVVKVTLHLLENVSSWVRKQL